MSLTNLYKIFKKDSMETRYLVRICRKMKLPYSALLGPEDWLGAGSGVSHILSAHKVGSNNQMVNSSNANSGTNEVMQLEYKLAMCMVEKDGLIKQVQLQNDLIDFLKKSSQ